MNAMPTYECSIEYKSATETAYDMLHAHKFQVLANTIAGDIIKSRFYDSYNEVLIDYKEWRRIVSDLGGGDISIIEWNSIGEYDVIRYELI